MFIIGNILCNRASAKERKEKREQIKSPERDVPERATDGGCTSRGGVGPSTDLYIIIRVNIWSGGDIVILPAQQQREHERKKSQQWPQGYVEGGDKTCHEGVVET